MSEIIEKLDTSIKEMMIPEVQDYIKDINKLIEEKKAKEDDYIALEEMESMYEDLVDIVQVFKVAGYDTYWLSNQRPISFHDNAISNIHICI